MTTNENDITIDGLTSKITALNEQLQDANMTIKALADATQTVEAMSERSAALLRSFIINKHPKLLPELCEYVAEVVNGDMKDDASRYDIGLLALQDVTNYVKSELERKRCVGIVEEIEHLGGFTEVE